MAGSVQGRPFFFSGLLSRQLIVFISVIMALPVSSPISFGSHRPSLQLSTGAACGVFSTITLFNVQLWIELFKQPIKNIQHFIRTVIYQLSTAYNNQQTPTHPLYSQLQNHSSHARQNPMGHLRMRPHRPQVCNRFKAC
jgi:hypothetical protein